MNSADVVEAANRERRQVLVHVTTDPRRSPRPAEAVRVAAGLAAWGRLRVVLYLHDAAVLALDSSADALKDGDHFAQYLPVFGAAGGRVYGQRDAAPRFHLETPTMACEPIDPPELAALAAGSHTTLRF